VARSTDERHGTSAGEFIGSERQELGRLVNRAGAVPTLVNASTESF
jgi:hypothetical protein